MRWLVSVFALLVFLASSGCAVIEKEKANRGGYLDYVLDETWMKADSKAMRALRAFAIRRGDVITVEQLNYSYEERILPLATLFLSSAGIPTELLAGFEATAVRDVIASQFGKNDREDEGTGTP